MTMVQARYWFQKLLGPLVWLAGLAMIVYYAPAAYRMLKLADGENIVGFLGHSHELLTILDSNPAAARRLTWRDREYPAIGSRVSAVLAHTAGDRVCIHEGSGLVDPTLRTWEPWRCEARDLDHDDFSA
jgi:hypothetical protein